MSVESTVLRSAVPTPPATPPAEGLRERNHRETQERIHLAALDLAETVGLSRTTTAHIALAADVSRRTFFRYFSCKEEAMLPGHRRYLDALDTVPVPAPTGTSRAAALRTIDAVGDAMLSAEGEPELTVHRRVSALLMAESELRAYAAAQDAIISERLAARLTTLFPDVSAAELTLFAEIGITAWRHGWIRWSSQAEVQDPELPAESHRATRAALREAFCGVTA